MTPHAISAKSLDSPLAIYCNCENPSRPPLTDCLPFRTPGAAAEARRDASEAFQPEEDASLDAVHADRGAIAVSLLWVSAVTQRVC